MSTGRVHDSQAVAKRSICGVSTDCNPHAGRSTARPKGKPSSIFSHGGTARILDLSGENAPPLPTAQPLPGNWRLGHTDVHQHTLRGPLHHSLTTRLYRETSTACAGVAESGKTPLSFISHLCGDSGGFHKQHSEN